jgi:PIN domain nuclease of toxin-antitoxin system
MRAYRASGRQNDRVAKRLTATEAEARILALLDEVAAGEEVEHERIVVSIPVRTWLEQLAAQVRTLPITPAVAATAVSLPSTFPGDLANRLIYATAIEHGCRLVTKDRKLRAHRHPRPLTLW